MRIELLNVECEFQVPVVFGRRNVYVTTVDTAASTSDMNNIGVTEKLKAENQLEWIRQMNACVVQAEETIKAELIYC